MSEDQYTEWKQIWKDEYLKWICGFANADGGVLEIGKDDNGQVVGIPNARQLLEVLPNKIRDILGILVNFDVHRHNGMEWVSIKVDAYPFPVNYKGQFHYRSGSTKQELKGAALNRFLLQKQGRSWDSTPVPQVSIDDLSAQAFAYFREQAIRSKRLDRSILRLDNHALIEQLRLNEGQYLKRAALLLFHPDPERFFTGACIKIGYFRTETDLRFQDVVSGTLFEQVERTVDLLLTKYMEAQIRYEGIHRVEEFPYPEGALREAVLNAVAHKDYSTGTPVQIKVYPNQITIWNPGGLVPPITVKRLSGPHPSVPYNPDVATTLFRAGLIESWGHGTIKIIEECKANGLPTPEFTDEFTGLMVTFYNGVTTASGKTSGKMSGKTSGKILTLIARNSQVTIPELAKAIGITERSIERNLRKLQEQGFLRRVGGAKGGHWTLINDKR